MDAFGGEVTLVAIFLLVQLKTINAINARMKIASVLMVSPLIWSA